MYKKFSLKILGSLGEDETYKSLIQLYLNHIFSLDTSKKNKIIDNYKNLFLEYESAIKKSIVEYIGESGSMQADEIESDWFPTIRADIFLSHSHKDKELALFIAAWIYSEFGLYVFIDSLIWGNCSDLLRDIDDKYCLNANKNTYSYEKRNISTAHVHLLLATALTKMIDQTECLFFLQTPNSINTKTEVSKKETTSAWIYHEISISNLIRINPPQRLTIKSTQFVEGYAMDSTRNFQMNYPVDLSNLTLLRESDLKEWLCLHKSNSTMHPLDSLYQKIEG